MTLISAGHFSIAATAATAMVNCCVVGGSVAQHKPPAKYSLDVRAKFRLKK